MFSSPPNMAALVMIYAMCIEPEHEQVQENEKEQKQKRSRILGKYASDSYHYQ